jgi:hypothetical protein
MAEKHHISVIAQKTAVAFMLQTFEGMEVSACSSIKEFETVCVESREYFIVMAPR